MKKIGIGLGVLMALAACKPSPPSPRGASEPTIAEPAAAAASAEFPRALQVAGVEPFWGVKVEGAALTYTTPETMDQPRLLQGQREQHGDVLSVRGGEGDGAFTLSIHRGPCSDGMSDLSHPFSAEFVLGKERFKGCARDLSLPVEAP